ncbi:MAG: amidase [Chloroflexi bacterium]|nr:amidase [Chloroflexota bacterium]MDA1145828.1 amidase [Chloroflexota bacterium]
MSPTPPYQSITEANAAIEAGKVTPLDLFAASLARIEETDERLNAFVRLTAVSGRAEAEAASDRARARKRLGPLDGIPIAVKDLYDTAGVVTAGGTGALSERVPAEDATTVRLLREAGAVIVGKTNTHELALGGTTNNAYFGATHNPWHLGRVPGGSSGGSGAAVAAGQALGALGSDTGGSIRIPAAFCGISGHKPTYGLVSRGGVLPLSGTLDHAGPMAHTAEDCALMLNILAGYDPRDLDSIARPPEDFTATLEDGVAGMTLAVIPSLASDCETAVLANFERSLAVLRELGATIIEREPITGEDNWRAKVGAIILAEAGTLNEVSLQGTGIAEPQRHRMLRGLETPVASYIRALEFRKVVEAKYEAGLAGIDGYLAPTSPIVAEPIAEDPTTESPPAAKFRNTAVFDDTHQPSLSVPNGFDEDGLPTGLMISTALWQDAKALRIGHAYQQATDFHRQAPPL